MAVTFLASACPAPVVPAGSYWLNDTGTSPPSSQPFTTSMTGVSARLNRDFKASDIAQRYGSGGYGIGTGLVVTAGTGLTANISDGQAMMDGVVELRSATPPALTAASNNWIWLKQDGTLVVQTTTAQPSGNCCLLGCAITDGSGVTSVDTAGVVYWKGGELWRETADPGPPGDTPSSSLILYTKTLAGTYLWNGSAYCVLPQGAGYVAANFTTDANKTLTSAQYLARVIAMTDTGPVLTTGRDVLFPAYTLEPFYFRNETAQTLTAKVSGQTGVSVTAGSVKVLRVDGTDVRSVM